MGPPWLGPGKKFQNESSQKAVKPILRLVFANTVNTFFIYALFCHEDHKEDIHALGTSVSLIAITSLP